MRLNQIADRPGARKTRTRIGRGIGSGSGKTGGRGGKGQTARSGVAIKGFEGGQMPLHRRLPKRGFNNIFAKRLNEINLGRVQKAIDDGKLDPKVEIDAALLVNAGLLRRAHDGVRLLGDGELKAKVTFSVWGASKSAIAAVEKAGGSVKVLAPPRAEPEPKVKKGKAAEAKPEGDAAPEGEAKAEKPKKAKAEAGAEAAAKPAKPKAEKSDKSEPKGGKKPKGE
jgi:large subunit ribosomal protein L15